MTLVSEGLLPALLGLLNAFLILTIVVVILYLYRWLIVERRIKTTTPTPTETKEKLVIEEKPKEKEALTTQEIAAAAVAVKHHIKSTLWRNTGFSEVYKTRSLWVLNWLNEATQALDHNPYKNLRRYE